MTTSGKGTKQKAGPRFRREERDPLRYQLSVWIARFLSWFFWCIPGPIRRYIALRLGSLSYRLSHGYRQNVESNIRTVLGRSDNDLQVRETTRHIFRTNALNFMDLLVLPRVSDATLVRDSVVVTGSFASIHEELAKGKGVIFVSAHIGCFDYIGQAFPANGFPLTVVTGRTTSRFVFDGVTKLRAQRGNHMVEPTPSGIRAVIRTLRNGGCAVLVADRDFFQNGHPVTFFGKDTTLPPGPVRIARDTGAAMVPVFTQRTARGHLMRILPAIHVEKTRDVDADVERGMQQLVPVLEAGITGCLDQWVMFQDVWPGTTEPIRIFPTGSPLESALLERVAQKLPEMRPTSGSGDSGR